MGLGILGWIVIGIAAGWLAEQVMGRNHGLLTNLIVGVVGALLGGFIAGNLLGIPVGGFNLITLLVAFLGACLLLFLVGLVKRRG
ncbi:GlsB/YeaQ/YmgE family stress response membrane protein [Brevundimonas sp. GCM10030266]|uniref:GlsB/YeaQ/YmgE family stress response membrane protein n=1 Tax=Brevundimonas sp. GCM10030266 TaxID=3273386 RepID=UPI0028094F79|nr:GlsB/YeaQ/YmgE family stress response membrane protein [Brevundimonas sp.]